MATTVQITGWRSHGLRCPDHDLSLEVDGSGSTYPVSLIQMPNGTGKTTTLQLLRVALSGPSVGGRLEENEILALKRRGSTERDGEFQVRLMIDEKPVTITLRFDFGRGKMEYFTTLGSGMKDGFHPPRSVESLLTPDVIDFVVFNGELAEQLVDRKHTDAETVIDALFKLHAFQRLLVQVEEYWEGKTRNRTAREGKGLNRRRNRVNELKRLIKKRKAEQTALQDQLDNVLRRLKDLQRTFKDGLHAHSERQKHVQRLERAEAELRAATERKRAIIEQLVIAIKDPSALAAAVGPRLEKFRISLDQVKLPESAAREFFAELAEQDICVCGRPIDHDSRKQIINRAVLYLGSSDVALLNAMKADIADANRRKVSSYESLIGQVGNLRTAIGDLSRRRTARDSVAAEAARGDADLEAVQVEIKELEATRMDLAVKLRQFEDATETTRDEDTLGLTVLRRRRTEAERMLAEITETLQIKDQRDQLNSILMAARREARRVLRERVRQESNESISARILRWRIVGRPEARL